MDPKRLTSLHDFIKYWKILIGELNNTNEREIASKIVSAALSESFEEYNDGDKSNLLFSDIFDYAVQLDRGNAPMYFQEAQWHMLKASLKLLEEQNIKK